MVVCRFFLQGSCRYGNNCRFEHTYPQKYTYSQSYAGTQPSTVSNPPPTTEQLLNQVVPEANNVLRSGQWPLSCYSPFKDKPNFPGFNDCSPEEIRLSAYEAIANGTLVENQNQIAKCYQESLEKFKTLSKPTGVIVRALETLYKGQIPSDPFTGPAFGSNTNSGAFGSGQNTGNIFGGASQTSGNLFNSTAANLFQTAATGLFGSVNNSSNIFAVKQEPINTFGSSNTNFGTTTSNDIFGSQVNAQTNPANLFANQNAVSFGNQATPFGNQATTFGNQATPFGNQATSFGQTNTFGTETSPSALFGAANAAIKVEPQNLANQSNVFGSSPFTANTNIFNSNPSVGNVFGVDNSSPFANPFLSNPQAEVIDDRMYSKLEDLSEKDLQAFQNATFVHGFIPEVPPPLSLCL